MNLRLSTCLFTPLLLTGCYTPYIQPQSGSVATIAIEKDSSFNYSVSTYVNPSDCSGGRIIVSPISENKSTTLKFLAGKPIALSFDGDRGVSIGPTGATFHGCDRTIILTPVAGEAYRALFTVENGVCQLNFLKANGAPLRPSEYQTRQWIRPTFDTGSFCKEL